MTSDVDIDLYAVTNPHIKSVPTQPNSFLAMCFTPAFTMTVTYDRICKLVVSILRCKCDVAVCLNDCRDQLKHN